MIGVIFTSLWIYVLIRYRHKIGYAIKTIFTIGLITENNAVARKKVQKLKEINKTQEDNQGIFQRIIDCLFRPVPLVAINPTTEQATASVILMKGYQEAIAIRKQTDQIKAPDIHQHIHYHKGNNIYVEKNETNPSLLDIEQNLLKIEEEY